MLENYTNYMPLEMQWVQSFLVPRGKAEATPHLMSLANDT